MDTPALLARAATLAPASLDAARRTVEVVFSTGARVLRAGLFTDPFLEELSLDPAHVRLGRLTSGTAPVLNAHHAADAAAVVGVVESARIERGEGHARLRFADGDPAADSIWNKIAQGVLRAVSVGYRVHTYEERPASGEWLVRRAVDWEPFEISVVPMGADPAAVVRSEGAVMEPSPIVTETPSPIDTERARIAEIMKITRAAELEPGFAEPLIAGGVSLDAARSAVLDALIARGLPDAGPRVGPSGAVHVGTVADRGDDFRLAAVDALCLRAGITLRSPHPAARDLTRTPVVELAKISLTRAGVRIPAGGPAEIIRRAAAMTTSDFPGILADSLGRAIRTGYDTEPASHRVWVRVVPVPDFRLQTRPILGSAPALLSVKEHGEYTRGPLTEDSASYRIEKWGRIVALTWEVLVNDELDAFLRVQPAMGAAARRAEADAVYSLFALNSGNGPTMQDGIPLFDATAHHNVTAPQDVLDADALGAGRTSLRRQTALGGGYLSLVPAYLIVAPEYETLAEQLLASGTRHASATLDAANPEWISRLTLVVDPRLAPAAVYLAASSAQIDTVELGVLDENIGGPAIDTRVGFDIDMTEYKCRHVFGPKALDWRGMTMIPITTPPAAFESRASRRPDESRSSREPDESPARPSRLPDESPARPAKR